MKKIYMIYILLSMTLGVYAQATDLVIDCQTPGWLSSKINYGDQQTVRKLKVTGYINHTDLKFIGGLIANQNLNEKVDLSEVNVVNNTLESNCFGISTISDTKLKCLSLPLTVEKLDGILPYFEYSIGTTLALHIDTLYFNCNVKYIKASMFGGHQYDEMPHNIIVGEKVDSIPDNAFFENWGVVSMKLPKGMRYIGNRLFNNSELQYCNFQDLEQLEYLGYNAFSYYDSTYGVTSNYQPDTLMIPRSLNNPFYLFAFAYKDGQHIFIEDNITEVSGYSQLWSRQGSYNTSAKLHFHINNMIPPSIIDYKFSNEDVDLTTSFVYVPKGAKDAYLKSDWRHATIIEANPIESIRLDSHNIELVKGKQLQLIAAIEPSDADNKTIRWNSSNEDIASVDESGNVTALKAGEVWIKAISVDNPGVRDSCKIIVLQPVTGITLSPANYRMNHIGESIQVEADVQPADATNKEVKWRSTNEAVCVVGNGLVISTGYGSAVVLASTVDGGFIASCVITVEDNTAIQNVWNDGQGNVPIYDLTGRRTNNPRKCKLYIRNKKKFMAK